MTPRAENLTLTGAELAACQPIAGEGGQVLRALCPFHGSDHQRSLRVTMATGRFVCFACGAWGYLAEAQERFPPGGTNSTQRDLMAGRPSELDAHAGAVVRLGRARGVPTPLHTFLYHSLLPLELHARGHLVFPR